MPVEISLRGTRVCPKCVTNFCRFYEIRIVRSMVGLVCTTYLATKALLSLIVEVDWLVGNAALAVDGGFLVPIFTHGSLVSTRR